ncbi:hypothetical protein ALC60_11075, partial [Trachymyrmex zeteki]
RIYTRRPDATRELICSHVIPVYFGGLSVERITEIVKGSEISLSELPRRLEVERGKIDTYTKQLDVKRLVAPDSSSRTTEGVEQERGFLLG